MTFARAVDQEKLDTFQQYRSLLQGIAYRMIGSVAEAEDIVQETFLKWSHQDTTLVRNARAWLVTTCSRLSIDRLKSAQVQRERYIGPWLPEPLLISEESPASHADLDDSISVALLYTLERLSPAERAAFLLHDVFDYSFEEIGEILEKSSVACRKLASRARSHAKSNKPRFPADTKLHNRLIESFLSAVQNGEVEQLRDLLAEDATLISDGGGKAFAARKPLLGADIICTLFATLLKQALRNGTQHEYFPTWFNGTPGVLVFENSTLASAYSFEVSEEKIQAIFVHRNPDKLVAFSQTNSE